MQRVWDNSDNYCLYQGHDFNQSIEKTINQNAEEVLLSASFNFETPPNSDDVAVLARRATRSGPDLEKQEFWDIKQAVLPKLFSNYTRRLLLVRPNRLDIFVLRTIPQRRRNLEFDAPFSLRGLHQTSSQPPSRLDRWQESGVEVSVIRLNSTSNKEAFWQLYESTGGPTAVKLG